MGHTHASSLHRDGTLAADALPRGPLATLRQMPFDPATLVAGPVIMIIAYAVFGISGFGSALVSIPLLAHFLPLRTVVPVILLLDFSAAIYAGWHFRREVDIKEVRSMVVGIVAGALLGVALLAYAPGDRLLLPLGVFVVLYATYNLFRHDRPVVVSARWSQGAGFLGGLFGAVYGVGGPVYATYFSGRIRDPLRLRASLSVVFSLSTSLRIVLFFLSGLLLDSRIWMTTLFLFPWTLAGTWIGRRVQPRLPSAIAARAVGGLLVLSGASLIARALQ